MFIKALLLVSFCTLNLFGFDEYWLSHQYLDLHPNQKSISQNFIRIIQNDAKKIATSQAKPVKIVMIYPGNQISDYWRRSKKSFELRLQELGVQYQLEDHFSKPVVEVSLQAKQLMEAIKSDTDYIIFTLDASKHKKFISSILTRQKPKLILQNITTPLKTWGDNQPFLYVGFDHFEGSKIVADFYQNRFQDKANYIVLYGPDGYVSDMRGKEFITYMQAKSKHQLLDTYFTDFNKQKAYNATIDAIARHPNTIDYIYACSTDIALGAIEALKDHNLSNTISINGWGGGEKELEMIEKGLMDATVMRINDDNGIAMAEAIKLDLEGKTEQVPTIFSGDFKLIKKGITRKELDAIKSWAFRYSK